jgi:hypothetical protein
MPRRQAKAEVPRWRRGQQTAAPANQFVFSGRQAKKLARQVAAAQIGNGPPVAQPAGSPAVNDLLAKTGAYRFRRQLIPVIWLAWVLGAGAVTHVTHAARVAIVLGTVTGAAIWLLTRHLPGTWTKPAKGKRQMMPRCAWQAMAALAVFWLPVLALGGPKPAIPLLLVCWLFVMIPWAKHYRIRPEAKKAEPEEPGDAELWAATLGAKGRLAGSVLSLPQPIGSGGAKYTLNLRRGEQDTADVFGMSKKIASLFGKPVTEVYAERFPDGREHQVTITRLTRNTLATVRNWDGSGIDPATGLAEMGDFPDGTPAHFRFWSPRNGAEQSIVVGVKGSGKSYLLHLLLSCAVTSMVPVVPIVLDPQQGQSLPDWRCRVTYARGADQCMAYLRAFEAGMTARSDYLAGLAWTDDEGYERPGMDFYDPQISDLPLIFMIFDEAHLVLGHPTYGTEAKRIVGNLVKLDRKAGGHLMLASHSLLLTELGDMTLRAMVVGGNVVALRTGENLSGGIIGLEADPKLLPRAFPDGSETHGLGYTVGPDGRPDSPMRARLVRNPRKVAVEANIHEMDRVFGDAWDASLAQQAAAAVAAPAAPLAAVPRSDDDEAAPEGRSAADAVLQVLDQAGGPLPRGVILERVRDLATGEWGRDKPFALRSVTTAMEKLLAAGKIEKPRDGTYALVRPSIHLVGVSGDAAAPGTGG